MKVPSDQSSVISGKKLPDAILRLKEATGISHANCDHCRFRSSDGDGYEYNGTWAVCVKIERMSFLKSFPFKKDMKCWRPEFWTSKFTENIKYGQDHEVNAAYAAFGAAVKPLEDELDAEEVAR